MGTILQVKNITKRFGGLTAVNDVSFEVERGTIVGLIGPNGAGKTTLFSIIAGSQAPTSGTIWFDGEDITGLKPHQVVDRGISRTFQLVRPLKTLSLLDNVLLGCMTPRRMRSLSPDLKNHLTELASKILASTGLIDRARFPPIILPHGDLRRLEIAKAIASNPELVLLDEPFSGLSHEEQKKIAELIQNLHAEGYTIIIVGHVLRELMALVPRIIALNRGRLIADGPPQDVANNRVVLKAYLGSEKTVA